MKNSLKVALLLLIVIAAPGMVFCKKNTSASTKVNSNKTVLSPQNKKGSSSVSDILTINKDSSKAAVVSTKDKELSTYSGAGVTSLKKGSSGFKVLPVTKITSLGNSTISEEELKEYLEKIDEHFLQNREDRCNEIKRKEIKKWRGKKRLIFKRTMSDTSHQRILEEFWKEKKGVNKYSVNHYYIYDNGQSIDSLIFLGHNRRCSDQRAFLLFPSSYPFLGMSGHFNYIGDNLGAAAEVFSLKPFLWDKNMKKYTQYTPMVLAVDSSSLVINSISGFEVSYKECKGLKPTFQEKCVFFGVIPVLSTSSSCFDKITLEKLSTVNGVSRFTGLLQCSKCFGNTWYIADVVNEHCELTLFELNDLFYSPEFYCAYSFGSNNLPDVFVWGITNDHDVKMKNVYYKSINRWVCVRTYMENSSECFSDEK